MKILEVASVSGATATLMFLVSMAPSKPSVYPSVQCPPEGIPATFGRIIDGDTFEMQVHLPLGLHQDVTVRLSGIDTPEMRGIQKPLGQKAKIFVQGWAGTYPDVIIFEEGTGKYGRLLARVKNAAGQSLTDELINAGHEKRIGK